MQPVYLSTFFICVIFNVQLLMFVIIEMQKYQSTMQELKDILIESIGITNSEWDILCGKLEKKKYKAKTTIIRQGNVAKSIFFLESGLIRTYHLQNGKEMNTYFACDGQFISAFSSFLTQKPSFEFLETIIDSVVYELSFSALIELYTLSSTFEKLGRILAEKNYLCVLDRTLVMQTKTAKEKYIDFSANYDKKIVQFVPQHMIATFLGIAPESLSRIRREIAIS